MKNYPKSYLVDTHCHLDMEAFDDVEKVISDSVAAGVEQIIIPSVDKSSFEQVIKIAQTHENVFCALGIHPTEAINSKDEDFEKIIEHAKDPKVVAIGECGLDYYWDKTTAEIQKEVFIKQIELAKLLKKPLLVHDREAHKETFDILVEHVNGEVPVVMHCFSGSVEFAQECIKKGFYIALGGVVTFKNAKKMHEVAKEIPLEHLLLETDAPYLTPVPYRGQRNEPAYVKFIAEEIAKIREISPDEVAKITSSNVKKVFKI